MKLVEDSSGVGQLMRNGHALRQVHYRIRRYQGLVEASGLPIPGLFRIEGSIDFDAASDPADWINAPLTLKLQDGRSVGITLVNAEGRVLSQGHGPMKCMCC